LSGALRNITKILNQSSRKPGRESKPAHAKFEAGELTTTLRRCLIR